MRARPRNGGCVSYGLVWRYILTGLSRIPAPGRLFLGKFLPRLSRAQQALTAILQNKAQQQGPHSNSGRASFPVRLRRAAPPARVCARQHLQRAAAAHRPPAPAPPAATCSYRASAPAAEAAGAAACGCSCGTSACAPAAATGGSGAAPGSAGAAVCAMEGRAPAAEGAGAAAPRPARAVSVFAAPSPPLVRSPESVRVAATSSPPACAFGQQASAPRPSRSPCLLPRPKSAGGRWRWHWRCARGLTFRTAGPQG